MKKHWGKIKRILELAISLARANFKLRNEGSYLGILWYLLNPLLLFLVIIFIRVAVFSHSKIELYPLYLLLGIIMNNLLVSTLASSIKSITENSSFLTSMKIEHESFVLSNVFQFVFSHLFEVGVFALFMVFYKVSLMGIIYYLIILLFFVLFLIGASFLFATIGTYVNDFFNIWTFARQILFFLTPIFYAIKPGDFIYSLNLFNPFFYFLHISRQVVLYQRLPEGWMLLIMVGVSLFFLFFGFFVFEKFKNKFADLL